MNEKYVELYGIAKPIEWVRRYTADLPRFLVCLPAARDRMAWSDRGRLTTGRAPESDLAMTEDDIALTLDELCDMVEVR